MKMAEAEGLSFDALFLKIHLKSLRRRSSILCTLRASSNELITVCDIVGRFICEKVNSFKAGLAANRQKRFSGTPETL